MLTAAVVGIGSAAASSPVLTDSADRVLGFYTGEGGRVVTTGGYRATFDLNSGALSSNTEDIAGANSPSIVAVYFQDANCLGTAYAHVGAGSSYIGGTVALQPGTSLIYSIAKNAPQVVVVPASRNLGGTCTPGSGLPPGDKFIPMQINDPAATGISNDPAPGPLKVEVAEVNGSSFDLFSDGFEGAFLDPVYLEASRMS